jgi:protease IV
VGHCGVRGRHGGATPTGFFNMRDFFKNVLATFVGLGLFVTLGIGGLAALVAVITASSGDSAPKVAERSVLTLDLSQPITDANPAASAREVIGSALGGGSRENSIALRSVLESLEQAATDKRIVGLYLSGSVQGTGFATLREVRMALQKFRNSGKPIYAYDGVSWQEKDYYLASVATQILLHPTGLLEINGLGIQTPFFAGALQKYGVGVQVLRVGKYKSAVEPYLLSGNSPENKEQTQKWLSDLWKEFLTSSAKSRKLTPQTIQAIADKEGLLLSGAAKSAGLVDKVVHEDEVVAELQKLTGEDKDTQSFRQINLSDYSQTLNISAKSSSNHIAVVYAEGDIVSGQGGAQSIGGDSLAELMRELRNNRNVKAIVLRVNSPGGSATASEQIAREVFLTNREKPVIVSMGNLAASGGYQISSYATRIFASPNTITGSIGVFGVLPNFQKIANDNGITWDGVKTGRFADSDTISRPKTAEELAIGQKVVNQIYDEFLTIVSSSRSIAKPKVNEIAQGRVWSGVEAKKIGLVDELGGIEDAIQSAAKQAKLGTNWELEEFPKPSSFEVKWLGQLFNSYFPQPENKTPTDPLTAEIQRFQEDFATLKAMNDPLGAYSRLPFTPKVD